MREAMRSLEQIYSAALSRLSLCNNKAQLTQCKQQIRSHAADVLGPENVYIEDEAHSMFDGAHRLMLDRMAISGYILSLFPAADWLRRYNLAWLLADLIGGLTIGLVVVPQAMAYAILAGLNPAFGLYTSFTGLLLYWIFGTSKDIVIGATAVGSLLVGQAIDSVNELRPDAYLPEDIARSLTLIVGILLVVFGLLRLGWVFEFIPYIPISAFVTAASLTIIVSQIPKVLGLSNINTKASAYRVALDTFGRLHETKWDALLGITVIVLLTVIKHSSAYMQKRHPQHAKAWKMISSLRMVVVMLLSMLISFLVNRNLAPHETKFRIVGHIDQGFQKVGAPQLDVELLALLAPSIPALFIILVVEHVAIAKAMSREHGYTIVTSQEVLASGMANTASPFFGGYVCTGSFGASAVLSSTGARTPLAGLFSGGVLVLALYALTTAFSYIPHATLAGLIIHAVWSLITPLPVLYKYWQISPTELLVWVAEVLLAVFTSLEVAMYTGIGLSIAVLLVRMARAKGAFVGQVQTNTVTDKQHLCGAQGYATSNTSRTTFARLDGSQGLNPAVDIRTPAPGVFVYGFTEGLNYTNQAQHMARIASYAKTHTRRGNPEQFGKDSELLWSSRGSDDKNAKTELPLLSAIVLDMSSVNQLDVTAINGLVDLRAALNQHTAPETCEIYFANMHCRQARKALRLSGFAGPVQSDNPREWSPAYTVALRRKTSEASRVSSELQVRIADEEQGSGPRQPAQEVAADQRRSELAGTSVALTSVDSPFIHLDLYDAVRAAVRRQDPCIKTTINTKTVV